MFHVLLEQFIYVAYFCPDIPTI